MIIQCPHCGERVVVNGLGRKRLNIPLKNICEALQSERNVASAARKLHCSQGYIFNALKSQGLKPKDIIEGKVTSEKLKSSLGGGDPLPGLVREVEK